MEPNYTKQIASELSLSEKQVASTLSMLSEGATIPFIARYRKERTGSIDEVKIANIRDRNLQLNELDKRRKAIIASIEEQDKMQPELKKKIDEATTMAELEDLYLPYKPKRKTKASVAKERGLELLARQIMNQDYFDLLSKAETYVDEEKEVLTVEDVLQGARDIIAEWINEHQHARKKIRAMYQREAIIKSKVVTSKEEEGAKYKNYFEWEENLMQAPSHRILAMFRGENENALKLKIAIDEKRALQLLDQIFVKNESESAEQIKLAISDSLKRLLLPSMDTEFRNMAKENADKKAIKIFAENLRQLLLAPPLGQKNVLAIDPGFRTGCKVVCLDKLGNLLYNETIYPHPPQKESKQAMHKILNLVNAYNIEAIAIGNGTAGRETEDLIRRIRFDKKLLALMVNENGASVYSASAIAREEFPDYDVTVRGAVSIGRRLTDPLAELVKIEPKSIGVGQYQHDVNQLALNNSLQEVVESCVNSVGVELNTASKQLLSYVSGLGPILAKNVVEYRNEKGSFKSRKELLKVIRFGQKAFEQAAGFLRIRDAENPLDRSAVHPESYKVVKSMTKKLDCTIEELIKDEEKRNQLNLQDFVTDEVGMPTLKDITNELAKPGRDPRQRFDFFEFAQGVHSIEDLQQGMKLPGIITNITAFGAFVDIGVHQDGLVHISKLADRFVKDPNQIVKLNQKVEVTVMEIDIARKRIQLSMID
ncbi:MAG: RNA-binding transcriptional accessory protein [Bacteroidetes bacterium]|nr:RNA-binding transcriptional accessory protein [Bacteroidota bacterium]